VVNNDNVRFVFAADQLRRIAPQEWSEFLAAFNELSDRERSKILSSPIEQLPIVQGRARMCHDLSELFEASKSADQMKEKLNERRTSARPTLPAARLY
jgi:hypothetical protein